MNSWTHIVQFPMTWTDVYNIDEWLIYNYLEELLDGKSK